MQTNSLPRSLGISLVFGFWSLVFVSTATAQPAAFTYQGRLTENGTPASGSNDLRFVLFDAPTNGNQISTNLTFDDVPLTNGLFTVALDWGAGAFDGSERWLELRVRPGNAGGAYTALAPRQRITSAPYALHSGSASNLLGVVSASQLPANASLLGNNIDSTEIVNGTIMNVDINATADIADTKLATINAPGKVANSATTATSANTPNTIVARDATGNFSAGTITGTFLGNGAGLTNLVLTALGPSGTVTFTTNSVGTFGFTLDAAYLTDNSPNTIRHADLNGDGAMDLVVVTSSLLDVFTNNGTGHFVAAGAPYATSAKSVTFGDFNLDGKMDLAVGHTGFSTIQVFTNGGNARFALAMSLPVSDYPEDVTAADFNGDGRMDLASADTGNVVLTNTLSIYTNSGSGFVLASRPILDYGPLLLEAGELNGDGLMDLVVSFFGTNRSVLLGHGNGTFSLLNKPTFPPRFALGDVNGDGRLDLVGGSAFSLIVFTNNGGGTLSSNATFALPFASVSEARLADVNGDAKLDALVAAGNNVGVLTNSGTGSFAVTFTLVSGTSTVSVGAADLNGDGTRDIYSCNLVDDTAPVFLNSIVSQIVTANFQGAFTGTALTVAGNQTVNGFNIVAQTTAAPTNNATLIPASGYVKFANTSAVTLNATTAIANGPTMGATLILEGASDVNTVTIPNAANTRLGAAHTLGVRDTLTLLWNGLNWLELSYANN